MIVWNVGGVVAAVKAALRTRGFETMLVCPVSDEPAHIILCPACGYDLRAATEDRCSECGLIVDRASLEHSGVPWAYRREIGLVRAFFKTVWMVTSDVKSLRHEAAKPQSPSDAAAFRRWVIASLLLTVGILTAAVHTTGGKRTALRQFWTTIGSEVMPRPVYGLTVPWSAGAVPPALVAYILLAAVFIARAPAQVIRTDGMLPQQAQAARAMAAYATAPLVLLVPAAVAFAGLARVGRVDLLRPVGTRTLTALLITWVLLTLFGIVATAHRTGQWRARVTRSGYATTLPAMAELALRWACGVALILGVVPWCVGLVWIIVQGFLR